MPGVNSSDVDASAGGTPPVLSDHSSTARSSISLPQITAEHAGSGRTYGYCPACIERSGWGVTKALMDERHPRCAEIIEGIRKRQPDLEEE